jgi:hypothetical protein
VLIIFAKTDKCDIINQTENLQLSKAVSCKKKGGYGSNDANLYATIIAFILKVGENIERKIDNCLNLDWLPEQVCGWLNRDFCISRND